VDGLVFTTQDAERLPPLVESVNAKVALGSQCGRFVPEDNTVRAGSKAGLAAVALGSIQYHHAIISSVDSVRRTDIRTGWLMAMHTGERQVVHGELGELPMCGVQRLSIQHLYPYP